MTLDLTMKEFHDFVGDLSNGPAVFNQRPSRILKA
jgi:hypothetical protein